MAYETTDAYKTLTPEASAAPFPETPASGPVCGQCGRVHPGGRFLAGCPGPRLRHGLTSALTRSGATTATEDAVEGAKADLLAELGDLGVVKRNLGESFVELSAVRRYLGSRLAREGPLTTKGRQRALLSAYLGTVDRLVRLASVLGIEKRRPDVDPLEAVRRAVEEANRR